MKIEERNTKLESLARSGYGDALIEYIEEKIDDLKDITKIKAQTIEEKGWMVQAREDSVKILKEIFRFLKDKREPKNMKEKNKYS